MSAQPLTTDYARGAAPDRQEAEVVRRLSAARVVPVATIEDAAQAQDACRALLRGGIACIEITFRTPAAADAIRAAREVEGMTVGAGTVLSPEQVTAASQAGADFAVAPGLNPEVIAAARRRGLPFFPGVFTPSEIEAARAAGITTVKLFPASVLGGPAFVRAVSSVYPDVRFIPTGGVSAQNMTEYLALPSVLAVGGSWLVNPALLNDGRYDEITRLAVEIDEVLS